MRNHLHAELIESIAGIIEQSPRPIHFFKVKAHSGVIGNEGADACARTAALMNTTDISLPYAKDPFYNSHWLAYRPSNTHADNLQRCNSAQPLYLTNLKDKLKAHMHNKHKLGSAITSGCYYTSWQGLNNTLQSTTPDTHANTGSCKPRPKLANAKISNSFWKNPKITLKQQTNVLKYRTGTVFYRKHSDSPPCPLCGATDSANHFILGCKHPIIQGMITNRHHAAVSLCGEAISQGRYASSIVTMDACNNEKLLEQDIEVPED